VTGVVILRDRGRGVVVVVVLLCLLLQYLIIKWGRGPLVTTKINCTEG
jgi:hypothetical protein